MLKFRCGADPEIFLQDKQGRAVSAIGLINADKWNPLQIPDMPKGYTLQEDNVSLEYGIPPAATEDEFVHHIRAVMEKSKEWIGDLTFSKLSCIVFPKEQMQHPAANIFGCEPDFNAWTGSVNKKPKPPHKYMRSAGGHIHVEVDQPPEKVARYMDLYLSVPAVIMDHGEERKQLYGKAGAFRPKPYGVEYRTLSNFWILDEKYIRWAWRNTARALLSTADISNDADNIVRAINDNNKDLAWSLINQYELEVV